MPAPLSIMKMLLLLASSLSSVSVRTFFLACFVCLLLLPSSLVGWLRRPLCSGGGVYLFIYLFIYYLFLRLLLPILTSVSSPSLLSRLLTRFLCLLRTNFQIHLFLSLLLCEKESFSLENKNDYYFFPFPFPLLSSHPCFAPHAKGFFLPIKQLFSFLFFFREIRRGSQEGELVPCAEGGSQSH